MNSADYTFLLNQPGAINDRQTEALEKIVTEFPYFQSARALRLKGLYSQNSFQYNFALKVAAAYTTDRSVLFDFITSDTFTTIQKGLYDQKLAELYGIDVNESEIVIEKNDEPAIDKVEQSILTSIKESQTSYEEEAVAEEADTNDSKLAQEAVLTHNTEVDEEETIIESSLPDTSNSEMAEQIPAVDALEEIEFVPVEEKPEEAAIEPTTEVVAESNITEQTAEAEEVAELQTPEAKLHIGEPLEFSKTETHSFQEWLQLSRIQPIQRDEPTKEIELTEQNPVEEITLEAADPKVKKSALIDRFIETNPKIPQMKPDVKAAVIEEPKEDHSALMTETLARVYLEQKKYQKAIQAYEILILKYPEKSSFFADRISEIKNLQQNNTL